ncbi:nucleotidyltransferase domain-containing protein [Neobacillus muris]|uniref:nucleotidyltransferase domain-containing protein n=1 Tax=Neobacillus muris TaxID=2941334 RepID=UPI00203D1592|nr:nucleotidyltransferase domain-containing protein [Neobacillus muris]
MENLAAKHREIAERFIEPLKDDKRIKGIAFLGSIGRNFGDKHSDIDIAVFTNEKIDMLHRGEKWIEGWDIEIFQVDMTEGNEDWDSAQKEAYQEGILVYDPSGEVKPFLEAALAYSDEDRMKEIVELLFDLGWHGWSYTEAKGKEWRGYNWSLPHDLWIQRGSIENAFYILHHCRDLLMDLLYAINRRWTPDFKWKYFKSLQLPWLPEKYAETMASLLLVASITEEEFNQKAALFQTLIDACYEMVMDDLPTDMYDYLVVELGAY